MAISEQYDCPPTLNDQQVIDFCKNGYLMLEGIVDDELNRRTTAFLDEHSSMEPTKILSEDWFVRGVLKHPQAAGAVRSLLGRDFRMPQMISNHRAECPRTMLCGWHRDGGAIDSSCLNYLQVFYYPQDTPRELGPTEVLPSSHFLRIKRRYMMHYGNVRKGVVTAAPAGSVFITHYSIWHRPRTATAGGIRNLLKFNYFRTAEPTRDWAFDPDVDFARMNWFTSSTVLEKWYDSVHVARMFLWLCGLGDDFKFQGGQSWPMSPMQGGRLREGMPPQLAGMSRCP